MRNQSTKKLLPIAGSFVTAMVLSAANVAAQEIELDLRSGNDNVAPEGGKRGGFALEEVVVTARKTEESVQDSPISVSAFSGDAMKSMGLTNLKDFDGVVPGLNMGGGGNGVKADGNPYIRGVGQRETKVTVDTAVATYIDGVYIGRAGGALMDAVDVASIQVLRGPQGTLFGKNSTGGAIVVTTRRPDDFFGGNLNATVGTYGRRNASGSVNIPMIEGVLASRFTLASTKSDGYTRNLVDGRKWSDDDRLMGIAQLAWTPTDDFSANFLWSATKTRQQPRGQKCTPQIKPFSSYAGNKKTLLENLVDNFNANGANPSESLGDRCAKDNDRGLYEFTSEFSGETLFDNGVYEVNTQTMSSSLSWYLNDTTELKSITAWRQTGQRADEDLDGFDYAFITRKMPEFNHTDQYSQELQIVGDAFDGRLRYATGLYAFLEETDNDVIQDAAGFTVRQSKNNNAVYEVLLPQSLKTIRETKNQAYSWFGQVYYDLTDYVELTFGLRYTTETRRTTYSEATVYAPGLFDKSKLVGGDVSRCSQKSLESGACSVTAIDANESPLRKFSEWQYVYDINRDGVFAADEVGKYGVASDERTDKSWTPMFSAKYLPHDFILDALRLDSAMLFFTYSEGFRSGGVTVANGDFSGNGIKDIELFEPEFVDNYEIGLKMEAFDQRLRGNFALFFTDYQDIQVTTVVQEAKYNLPLPAIENAGQAEIKGFEGELTILPTQDLRIMFNFAYTDGRYLKYTVDSSVGGVQKTDYNRADEPMPRVADWTAFLSMDYTFYTENYGMVIPSVAVRYTDEIYHGFDRDSFLITKAGAKLYSEAAAFVDARLTWILPDERTTLTFWGKNLENKEYFVGGIPLVGVGRATGSIYAEPRTFGLDVSYKFGDEL